MSSKIIKLLYRLPVLLCWLLLWATPMPAQSDSDFPPAPNPPRLVNDLANVLSPAQQQALEQKLVAYNDSTSTQVTIVTVQSIGGYEIAQYATELGNRWKAGQKGKDNGVIILAAIKDHKVNISPGYGLEGALPDALCGRIIRNEIVPAFKQNDYYTGFNKAADAIIAAAKGEYEADAKPGRGGDIKAGTIFTIALLVFLFIWIVSKTRGGGGGGGGYMSRGGRRSWDNGGWIGGIGGLGGFGGGFGGGRDSGSSDSGGGFGGFGGGSFGGGGASGDW